VIVDRKVDQSFVPAMADLCVDELRGKATVPPTTRDEVNAVDGRM
jgi:hypothetical protein